MAKHSNLTSLLIGAGIGLVALAVYFALFTNTAHAPEPVIQPTSKNPVISKPSYDTTTASSVRVIVNKQHPMSPIDYVPAELVGVGNGQQMRREAAEAFLQMQTDAATAEVPIIATSGYRSYSYQQTVYDNYVTLYGVAETDTFSARPGYSEHQTGLVVDIEGGGCRLDNCFAETAQGKWLATNAYKYGFILRYPSDKTDTTGYAHEAWHWRYVGTELASDMHDQGIKTLEEYFVVTGGTTY